MGVDGDEEDVVMASPKAERNLNDQPCISLK
jgi:hypothetical protein